MSDPTNLAQLRDIYAAVEVDILSRLRDIQTASDGRPPERHIKELRESLELLRYGPSRANGKAGVPAALYDALVLHGVSEREATTVAAGGLFAIEHYLAAQRRTVNA